MSSMFPTNRVSRPYCSHCTRRLDFWLLLRVYFLFCRSLCLK